MNRYRTIPGLPTNNPKATSKTVCQKCLKRGHYSYECKASTQERPYVSRASRTQQLLNPRLAPKLLSEKEIPNELLRKNGVADEQLAAAEAERSRTQQGRRSRSPQLFTSSDIRRQSRSLSRASSDSVSTISTNKSRSRSPSRYARGEASRRDDYVTSQRQSQPGISRSRSKNRKRKYRSSSRDSDPHRSPSRSPSRPPSREEDRKIRRHRTLSPDDRGRQSSFRRGSHRSRSRSRSISADKSQIAKGRRSLDSGRPDGIQRDGSKLNDHYRGEKEISLDRRDDRNFQRSSAQTEKDRRDAFPRPRRSPPSRRERSLSPYSKRLALTQAMNMPR